jgi:hypothetical protein
MFTLDKWVSAYNIKDRIKTDLDKIKDAKHFYEYSNLKFNVIQEIKQKYDGW